MFFFQAEDGIRDYKVTGVQTCALPISTASSRAGSISRRAGRCPRKADFLGVRKHVILQAGAHALLLAQPKRWIEQVAVVLVEDLARARVADQEALELLREHIVHADPPVGLGG